MTVPPEENIINAAPTKEFFISMLVKDIPLIRAIIDLVDNCVDGARRLREYEDYEGLEVDIKLDSEQFVISDNCGGISLEIAKNYAFRFGRPPEAQEIIATDHSVGLFGVGMKRAIFKMGNYFKLESLTDEQCYVVEQDINEWSEQTDWKFSFNEIPVQESNLDESGTLLTITHLHESITQEFALENFRTELQNKLEAAHRINIEKGLSISLDGHQLESQETYLLNSDEIKPSIKLPSYDAYPDVKIKIYAGIYERGEPEKAGWYLYCNDRLVLYADKDSRTGWGDGRGFPQYHNDFAYFRGYVFLVSKDAGQLPWNTTKTGVDEDDPLYKSVREDMKNAMRPVIRWLQKLSAERSEFGETSVLQVSINEAEAIGIDAFPAEEQNFEGPQPAEQKQSNVSSIQ